MKVVILCGGIGYRLKEETEFKPKPMVLIGNKPILWHIMKIYSYYGFNEFIIALGYKGEYIKDYFLNQKYFLHDFTLITKTGDAKIHQSLKNQTSDDDFKITFVNTGENALPGERILRIKDYIPKEDDNFMVTYGDGVGDVDISDLFAFHKRHGKIGTITGVHPRSKYGLVKTNKRGIATEFLEKPVLSGWVNGGFMCFKKEVFRSIKLGEYEHKALHRLVRQSQLAVYVHRGFWHSMDTYADVESLNQYWQHKPAWKLWLH